MTSVLSKIETDVRKSRNVNVGTTLLIEGLASQIEDITTAQQAKDLATQLREYTARFASAIASTVSQQSGQAAQGV